VYEPAEPQDGTRILVDRLWPRGLSKERAAIDRWEQEISPSDELRKEFNHEPERFEEFRAGFLSELEDQWETIEAIAAEGRAGRVTLLFAAREERYNNAVVLAEAIASVEP
jgi:uncharacterized protein YeaO (DUF488 family)